MMCKIKGWIQKGGHYDVQIKGRGTRHYDVEMTGWMQKGGIISCKLKGWMDKGEHYNVEMKGCMQKGGHYYVQIKTGGWKREGIMLWKLQGGCKRGALSVAN